MIIIFFRFVLTRQEREKKTRSDLVVDAIFTISIFHAQENVRLSKKIPLVLNKIRYLNRFCVYK